MSDSPTCDVDDLVLLAMRLLPAHESTRVQEQILNSAECQHDFHEIQEDLAIFALGVPIEKPSETARDRLLTQVAREQTVSLRLQPVAPLAPAPLVSRLDPLQSQPPQSVASSTASEQRSHAVISHRWLRWLRWSGWATAAGVSLLALGLLRDRAFQRTVSLGREAQVSRMAAESVNARAITDALSDSNSVHVKLSGAGSNSAALASAVYAPSRGTLVFVANHLPPAQPRKAYELWVIPADGRAPVPAITFRPDGDGSVSIVSSNLPRDLVAKAFGITLENEAGATSPTPPLLMAGNAPQPSL